MRRRRAQGLQGAGWSAAPSAEVQTMPPSGAAQCPTGRSCRTRPLPGPARAPRQQTYAWSGVFIAHLDDRLPTLQMLRASQVSARPQCANCDEPLTPDSATLAHPGKPARCPPGTLAGATCTSPQHAIPGLAHAAHLEHGQKGARVRQADRKRRRQRNSQHRGALQDPVGSGSQVVARCGARRLQLAGQRRRQTWVAPNITPCAGCAGSGTAGSTVGPVRPTYRSARKAGEDGQQREDSNACAQHGGPLRDQVRQRVAGRPRHGQQGRVERQEHRQGHRGAWPAHARQICNRDWISSTPRVHSLVAQYPQRARTGKDGARDGPPVATQQLTDDGNQVVVHLWGTSCQVEARRRLPCESLRVRRHPPQRARTRDRKTMLMPRGAASQCAVAASRRQSA